MIKIKIKSKLQEAPHAEFEPIRNMVKEKTGKIIKLPNESPIIDDFIDFSKENQNVKGDFSAPFDTTDGKKVYVMFNKYGDPLDASTDPFDKESQFSDDWMKKAYNHMHGVKEAKPINYLAAEEEPQAHMEESFEIDEDLLDEKKDRCYYQAKRKYTVFPSAYASGYIVRCRKGKVGRKKKKKNESIEETIKEMIEDILEEGTFDKEKSRGLKGWFDRQGGKGKSKGWVDCNTCRANPKTGRKTCKSCGRQEGEKRSKYPACRPTPSACTKAGTSKKKSSKRVSWKSKKEE